MTDINEYDGEPFDPSDPDYLLPPRYGEITSSEIEELPPPPKIASAARRSSVIELPLPRGHRKFNQGKSDHCLGFSAGLAMSVANNMQNKTLHDIVWTIPYRNHIYDMHDLGHRAKGDEWIMSEVLKNGPKMKHSDGSYDSHANHAQGIERALIYTVSNIHKRTYGRANVTRDWFVTQVANSLHRNMPVVLGFDFNEILLFPKKINGAYYVPRFPLDWGWNGKGHAVCIYGIDYGKKAFKIHNSWGPHWGHGGTAFWRFNDLFAIDVKSNFIEYKLNTTFSFYIDRITF